ncbi:MAG: hypothetical protein HQL17_04585 [Candidatus Omnitrophica bacterium]|nr:hypothetical protein [Candidatus Omnitrophota bacterium]
MNKLQYILKEMSYLVNKHKLAFLLPIFIVLILLVFIAYYVGPAAVTTFIYAGI